MRTIAEEFDMNIGIGIVAVAAMLAGCTVSSSNGPEETMKPAAGAPLTYDARTMVEFDASKDQADKWCRANEGEPAHYVDRTPETARFECAPK